MPFPSPPWRLQGQLWLSLFPVRRGTPDRPAGLYGVAFVDYQRGGVLAYQELLVARLVRDGAAPRAQVTDIWVNSEPSRDGGRSLWAMPKELAELRVTDRRTGLVARSTASAAVPGCRIARATFTAAPGVAVRAPLALTTLQRREDGSRVVAAVRGSARALPCLGSWRFASDGPLAWLRDRRPVLSLRLTDFRITFAP